MVEQASLPENAEAPPLPAEKSGRLVSIDILRGLAILWVMTFHLYIDMTFKLAGAAPLYPAFADRVGEQRLLPALTALGELVLGQGYMGVAIFMMLSGLSLTLNSYRRPEPGLLQGYANRFRKIIVAYWGGVLILVSAIATIALLQMLLDGGSYADQWWNVRIGSVQRVNVVWDDVLWALSVFLWPFRTKMATIPAGSLWFVQLLLQYYLIFPFALVALKRIGPWKFAAATVILTLLARALLVHFARHNIEDGYLGRYMTAFSVFRASEFGIGMSLGYLFVHKRDSMRDWVSSPLDSVGLVVIGVLFIWAGTEFALKSDTLIVFSDVMVAVGLAVIMLPLLFKAPGRLEGSALARSLVFLGVVSFMALVVDDVMRYVGSFLRYEGYAHGPAWWFFLVVVYIPGGALIAYPLSRLFGLLPKERSSAARALEADSAGAPKPIDMQPVASA